MCVCVCMYMVSVPDTDTQETRRPTLRVSSVCTAPLLSSGVGFREAILRVPGPGQAPAK